MKTLLSAMDLAGTFVFALSGDLAGVERRLGLAFFAASGAQKAIAFGLGPAMAALLGMLTGSAAA